ncbi:protein dprB [Aspergillus fumigatus Af293]|uniref:Cell surface protein n=1 Tax=Aspergillus fumigatus (strain ATCC MYA-4609 / CBS 101355 / FGSC A1100 / Af293) TaxID=330879 RepID=Q4WLV5_ASPFU|nr:conserved hypothetical protein [Aspergillus fumigatus Af293]EAL89059.1 conserved hypothetical protein [Aspergillus fumigatus Af293]
MSGLMHKVKDAVTGHHHDSTHTSNTTGTHHGTHQTTADTTTTNHGPHHSKLANKLDPRVDSDGDHHPGSHATITRGPDGEKVAHTSTHGPRPIEPGHGHSAATGTTNTTHGPHSSKAANKLDPRVDSDADNRARHEAIGGAHGPHSSNIANKVDPRVDSDRDNHAHTGAGATTTTGAYASGAHNTYGTTSTNAGPHNSNMLNKVDPRIDSDMDNRARHETMGGAHGPHGSSIANKMDPRVDSDMDNRGAYGTTTTHGTGAGNTFGTHTSSNAGPHNSSMMNKVDPRVDSDMDNRARHQALGGAQGPHSSNLANKIDPRVDSDMDNRGTTHGTTGHAYGSGAGMNTSMGTGMGTHTSTNAGPHNSNLMNKVDPRVDSNRDNRARHETLASNSYNTPGATTHTAGPHNSNLMNKIDPPVDSDLDNRGTHTLGTQRGI